MFLYFGDTLVNIDLVRSVRTVKDREGMRAEVTFSDGTVENLTCSIDVIEDLEDRIIKAPKGYKAISCFADDDGRMAVIEQEIVAFRYKGADTDLLPITPYMMKESGVLSPGGQVATPGARYDSLSDYLREKEKEFRESRLPAKRTA